MSQACEGWRGEIGAYVVGALEPGAGARVRRHLRTCRTCRAEFEDLVPVRDWLTKLTHADGSGAGRRPGSAPLLPVRPALPMRLWPALPLPRPRGLRSVAAVTVAAAVAVLAVVLGRPGTPAFQAGDRITGVHGQARLHATAAGTEIRLVLAGLPPDERCVLVGVSSRGTDVAATWTAKYDGSARITGTSAIPERRLTALRVESAAGELLLSIGVAAGARTRSSASHARGGWA